MLLYRPVGVTELQLIEDLNWCAFPPRLPIQPIFYPVLNFDYAAQIAREWNTKDPVSGFAGFVTRFEIDNSYATYFEVQTVGTRGLHDELWVAAEELDEFNKHIIRPIEVIACFYGPAFTGQKREFSTQFDFN
ncbi:ADP-ribosylation/crystallin J1 [bacterium]|nr:MAG: ADP-ribosylation/crystallin J1 [bacterium]